MRFINVYIYLEVKESEHILKNIKQITRQIVHRYVRTVSMMLEQWRFGTLPECKNRTEDPYYSDLIHVYEKSWSLQSTLNRCWQGYIYFSVQLILEQHRFGELYRPTYTQIFFNKSVL